MARPGIRTIVCPDHETGVSGDTRPGDGERIDPVDVGLGEIGPNHE